MALPYQLHQKKQHQQQQQDKRNLSSSNSFDYSILQKVFWVWDKNEHLELARHSNGNCCWNHIVGLPVKDRWNGTKRQLPLFDYQETLFNRLFSTQVSKEYSFKNKHLWLLKSTGIGATEFFLRIMAWLATSTNQYRNSQMVIVTGPNLNLAIGLIKRLKTLFEPKLGLVFSDKETVLNLNGCHIEAYPSNHVDSFRSLTNPKFIFCDESDMFRKKEQDEVRDVVERYIAKSQPYIVMCSTPGAPGGLMYRIEHEDDSTCIYKRLKMDYHYGVGKIYSREEIENARHSPSFPREYELQYLGKEGNVFPILQIDRAVQLGEQYSSLKVNPYCIHSIGVDPGFSSSNTAIVASEFLPEEKIIRVIFAEEYEKGDPQKIVNLIFDLHQQYGFNTYTYVDGANRAFVNLLKVAFDESLSWEKFDVSPEQGMRILPVNFATDHKQMLAHLATLLSKEYLAIPKKFDKLIVSLRTAYAKEYSLDKGETSYSDSLDAARLSCRMYKME